MADTTRCGHQVSALAPGGGWITIQCDADEGHPKRFRPNGTEHYPIGHYDHGNSTYAVHWNEDHENAILPDMPPKPDEKDPEPGKDQAFVIHMEYSDTILGVAMNKAARDHFIRVYNMNRDSGLAVWELTDIV